MTISRVQIEVNIKTHLERIFARETLLTVSTWERLYSEMNTLMSFQIVIAIEALRTLVAFEGPFVGRAHLLLLVTIELLKVCGMATVVAVHHARMHAAHKGKVATRVVDIREYWPR